MDEKETLNNVRYNVIITFTLPHALQKKLNIKLEYS